MQKVVLTVETDEATSNQLREEMAVSATLMKCSLGVIRVASC